MKKMIIIFIAISILLVSCSTPSTPTSTPGTTNTDSNGGNKDSGNGTNNGSDNGNNGGDNTTPSNPQPTQYTVTFDSNGGSSVTSQTVAPNGHATRPANPTKEGYAFDYWYSTDESSEYNFTTATINSNLTLHAKWRCVSFELGSDGTVNSFTYKVKFSSNNVEYNASLTYDTSYHLVYGNGTNGIVDIELRNTKVIFTNHDNLYKVSNVSVNGNVVTIELVNNN